MMTSLKFKNEAIKLRYLNSATINRICEVSNCERILEDILSNGSLNITTREDLAFVSEDAWDDLIVAAEIDGFEYAFCFYSPENKELNVKSCLGNVKITNEEVTKKDGIFANCSTYDDAENVFLPMINKNYYYLDIVYYEGKEFI